MVRVGRGLAAIALLVLVASFLGRVHPLGDSLAVFRLPLAAVTLILFALVPMRWMWRLTGVAVPLGALSGIGLILAMPGLRFPDHQTTVYQKNLWYRNPQIETVAEDIRVAGAEIVTLQEVSTANEPVLEALNDIYPTHLHCAFSQQSGAAVLTSFPASNVDPICSQGRGMAAIKVVGPEGPLWLVSLHLHWPWPYRQRDQLESLLPVLEGLDAPVVLGGDFNMVPWSSAVARVQRASKTLIAVSDGPTLIIRRVPLLIDHVLAPGGGTSQRRPRLGSDHFGVLATVSLMPSP